MMDGRAHPGYDPLQAVHLRRINQSLPLHPKRGSLYPNDPGRATTARPFRASAETHAPDASSRGVFVLGVPSGPDSLIDVSVSHAGAAPVAQSAGDVS